MRWAQTMRRWADVDLNLWFEFLMALLLAKGGDETLKRLNPFLTEDYVRMVTDITAGIAFRSSRVSQLLRCEDLGDNLAARLRHGAAAGGVQADILVEELYIEAMKLADVLGTSRHFTTAEYVGSAGNTVTFDPRLLFFEFAHDIVLRKSQVELIEKFKRTITAGESMCHQMIMGAGKTTVVGPLMALMLADGRTLVMQIVPQPLLEMSRSVLRAKFSAVVRKPIYTLTFTRTQRVDESLVLKLQRARDSAAVVVAGPTASKSIVLKLMLDVHALDQSNIVAAELKRDWATKFGNMLGFDSAPPDGRVLDEAQHDIVRKEIGCCVRVLEMMKSGALILDEVDLLLHPLKSELNWPIGGKEALDFTEAVGQHQPAGLRWEIPFHLLSATFFAMRPSRVNVPSEFLRSRDARNILLKVRLNAHTTVRCCVQLLLLFYFWATHAARLASQNVLLHDTTHYSSPPSVQQMNGAPHSYGAQ